MILPPSHCHLVSGFIRRGREAGAGAQRDYQGPYFLWNRGVWSRWWPPLFPMLGTAGSSGFWSQGIWQTWEGPGSTHCHGECQGKTGTEKVSEDICSLWWPLPHCHNHCDRLPAGTSRAADASILNNPAVKPAFDNILVPCSAAWRWCVCKQKLEDFPLRCYLWSFCFFWCRPSRSVGCWFRFAKDCHWFW